MIANLPDSASRAEKMLGDEDNAMGLMKAYCYLSHLEARVLMVKNTLETLQGKNGNQLLPSLDAYFKQVHGCMSKVEYRIFSIMRSFMTLASQNPKLLVTVLNIIEIQEAVDSRVLSSGLGMDVISCVTPTDICILQFAYCDIRVLKIPEDCLFR